MTERDKKDPKKPDGSKDEIREVDGVVGEDTFFDEISAKLEALSSGETDSEPVDKFFSIELGPDDPGDLPEDPVDKIISLDLGGEDAVDLLDYPGDEGITIDLGGEDVDDLPEDPVDEIRTIDLGTKDADDLLEDPDDEIITIDLGGEDGDDLLEGPVDEIETIDLDGEDGDDLLEDPGGSDFQTPSKEILTADFVKTIKTPDRRTEMPAGGGMKTAASGTRKSAPPASALLSRSKKSERDIRRRRGKTLPKTVLIILASLSLPVVAAVVGYLYLFSDRPLQAPVPVTAQKMEPASPAVVRKKITMPQKTGTVPVPRKPPPAEKKAPAATSAAIEKRSRPAQPGPGTASVSPPQDMRAEIPDFLSRWKGAWEKTAGKDGDMDAYIAFYSDAFSSRGFDKNGWRTDKKSKNRRKAYIEIHLSDIRISPPGPDGTVTVTFFQDFRSSNYSGQSRKALVLRQEAGGWKILEDR